MKTNVLDDLDELDAAVTPRLCLCGCERPVDGRPGPGRPSVYATPQCRRAVEYEARKVGRVETRPAHGGPRESRATLGIRVADPVKLAREWFRWRYPAHYAPVDDSRNPARFRTILGLKSCPSIIRRLPGFTVRLIRGSDMEVTELARWIRWLPRYQQQDFASRAIEARTGKHVMAESPDKRVSHGDILDRRPDPVTLGQLRNFYKPGECLEAGCHDVPHADGLCRRCYDDFRR